MPPKDIPFARQQQGRPRQSSADRRAAEFAASVGKQAQLKQEAADRRVERARHDEAPPTQ